jgi:hypothetical protein
MNTIKIRTRVESTQEIAVPFFGKYDGRYICCTGRDKHNHLTGLYVRKGIITDHVCESDVMLCIPCTPAEFAAAFEEAHHNLRAEYEAIIEAQEGGKP